MGSTSPMMRPSACTTSATRAASRSMIRWCSSASRIRSCCRAPSPRRGGSTCARDWELGVVRDALASVLPEGLQVTAPAQRKVDLHRIMRSVQVMLQGVSLLVLLAAFLIVFNRLSAVFEARIWQVGVMRAMGLRPMDVWLELLVESSLIGAAGVAVGLASGVGLARLMLPVL